MTTEENVGRHEGEYLWDPGATPDPEVQRLEEGLRAVRHRGTVPAIPAPAPRLARTARWGGLVAAVVAVAFGVTWSVRRATRPSWEVLPITGAPSVDSSKYTTAARLKRGDWLETDSKSRATVNISDIGSLTVEPGTRLRLVASRQGLEHRMELAKGTIQAFITAPPRLFFVDTPSAQAIDMGCIYTLAVADDKSSELKTTFGLVELAGKAGGRDVLSKVPTGAVCRTDPRLGPGTPRFADAPEALVAALDRFDAGATNALPQILAGSRARDTLTLWHLLSRTSGSDPAQVLGTIVALVGRPAGVTDRATLGLDAAALDTWWSFLRARWDSQ